MGMHNRNKTGCLETAHNRHVILNVAKIKRNEKEKTVTDYLLTGRINSFFTTRFIRLRIFLLLRIRRDLRRALYGRRYLPQIRATRPFLRELW